MSQKRRHDFTSASHPSAGKSPQGKAHLSGGEELHAPRHLEAVRDQVLHSEGQLVELVSICTGGTCGWLQRLLTRLLFSPLSYSYYYSHNFSLHGVTFEGQPTVTANKNSVCFIPHALDTAVFSPKIRSSQKKQSHIFLSDLVTLEIIFF